MPDARLWRLSGLPLPLRL